MPNSSPTNAELRSFLIREMNVLDKVWEGALDEVWTFTPSFLSETIAKIADEFYQEYWEMFRAVLQEPGEKKSWEEMQREATAAGNNAQGHVSNAWSTVVSYRIDRSEQELDRARKTEASLLQAKKLFRDAKSAQTKAEKHASHDRHSEATSEYREAINFVIECDDEIEEARRRVSVLKTAQEVTEKGIRISVKKYILLIVTTIVAVAGLIFSIWTQSSP